MGNGAVARDSQEVRLQVVRRNGWGVVVVPVRQQPSRQLDTPHCLIWGTTLDSEVFLHGKALLQSSSVGLLAHRALPLERSERCPLTGHDIYTFPLPVSACLNASPSGSLPVSLGWASDVLGFLG